MEVWRKTIDTAMMHQQICMAVVIGKRADVPPLDGLSFVKYWPTELIGTSDGVAGSIAGAWVFVSQIVGVHQHHVFASGRAAKHLGALPHSSRSHAPIRLLLEGDALEVPVHQIVRRIAAESGEHIGRV